MDRPQPVLTLTFRIIAFAHHITSHHITGLVSPCAARESVRWPTYAGQFLRLFTTRVNARASNDRTELAVCSTPNVAQAFVSNRTDDRPRLPVRYGQCRALSDLETLCKTISCPSLCHRLTCPRSDMRVTQRTILINARKSVAPTVSSSRCSIPIEAAAVSHGSKRWSHCSSAAAGPISQHSQAGSSKEKSFASSGSRKHGFPGSSSTTLTWHLNRNWTRYSWS